MNGAESRERTDPGHIYLERSERFAKQRDHFAERELWISHARVTTFLAALVFLLTAAAAELALRPPLVIAGALFLIAFFALVRVHARARAHRRWFEALRTVSDEAQKRLHRDWDGFPMREPQPAPPGHGYAQDLDLIGHASLLRLLDTAATLPGSTTLRDWLLQPPPPERIPPRQQAVAELAPMLDLRDELTAHGRLMGAVEPRAVERFLAWAEDEPWLSHRPVLVWTTRLLPALTATLIFLDATRFTAFPFWVIPIAAALLLTRSMGPTVHRTFGHASSGQEGLERYDGPLALLSDTALRAPLLRQIQRDLTAGELAAHRQMRRLARLARLSDLRYSMLHLPIHLLTLWDFHVLLGLERWQRTAGRHARGWFRALGQAEALSALAALHHAHPGWAFPEIVEDDAPMIEATALAHPLLPPHTAVGNDVAVGPPGTFLLVTGSNMAGKSTLLRAIGINVVLAQAGGPVCATRMRLPPLSLYTSMRIQDSLEQGLSQFMAELKRLKEVVDAARLAHREGERTLLYLLDEILRGTNTVERQVAARRILRHLLESGSIGAVTTHDLELADADELAAAAHKVHFRETVEAGAQGPILFFDYELRPGLATSTNALTLLEIVGLKD